MFNAAKQKTVLYDDDDDDDDEHNTANNWGRFTWEQHFLTCDKGERGAFDYCKPVICAPLTW